MTYVNAVKYLASLPKGDANVERAHRVCELLSSPQHQLKSVHICGKYGKNSCHRMLSSILIKNGMSVGGYSPSHASEPREAITLNGTPLPYDTYADTVRRLTLAYTERAELGSPSYDELLCLASIVYFSESKCDVCIFEKGIGKNDAVNVTETPAVSVVASMIDLSDSEHSFVDSFRKGTRETVSATQSKAIYSLISERCVEIGSRLTVPIYSELEIKKINLFKTVFTYRGNGYTIRSFSPCQTINAITVIEAAEALSRVGLTVTQESVRQGLECTTLPSKCEAISLEPAIIVGDVSDNVRFDTMIASIAQIKDQFKGKIRIALDPKSITDTEKVRHSLASANIISVEFIEIPRDLTPARYAKHIGTLVDPLLTEDGKLDALIFMGGQKFIMNISEIVKKHLGKI